MSNKVGGIGILGIGANLPDKVITNSDIEKMVDTSNEWIIKRTGISERRILDKDKPAYGMGVAAAKEALKDSGIDASEIGLIILTTEAPDYLTPSVACLIQKEIGAVNAAAFDMNAACTGFIYGITVASQFIQSGYYKYALVISCEGLSKITDWEDRNTCILFGDGAGAVVLGKVDEGEGIISTYLGADGQMGQNITIPCCHLEQAEAEKRIHDKKQVIWMDGSEVFKFAVRIMAQATLKVLEQAGMSLDEIKMIVPHQANIRIVEGALKRLGVPMESIHSIIQKYGNISSASIPVTLYEAIKENKVKKGEYVLLVGFGGGLTWGSAIIRL